VKTHTHTTTSFTIPGTEIEVELPIQPDSIMDFKEPLVRITPDQIVLGYLAHDDDCDNPLEDCDGMGHIYECRRHGSTLEEYCKALGLRCDGGGPDLELVDEDAVVAEAHRELREQAELAAVPNLNTSPNFDDALERCEELYTREPGQSDIDFVCACLDTVSELSYVIDTDTIREKLWEQGRANGTIGSKYAVLLDVYEHGGIAYSLSGDGMQCQFDTARAGAVWVPDDCCVDEIKRRAEVYRKGKIWQERGRYAVRTWESFGYYDPRIHPNFEHWGDAFDYLKTLQETTFLQDLPDAERQAARELAKSAAEEYTKWCNGDCYGVVVVTYDKDGEQIDWDSCWGFIGDDYAYESLVNDYFPKETAFRAAYIAADPGSNGAGVLLSSKDEKDMPDDQLLALARQRAEDNELTGDIVIGEWRA